MEVDAGDSVDARLYLHESVYHVIAVNHEKHSVNPATFKIQSQSSTKSHIGNVDVLFENRDIQVEDGEWTDDFGPYGVHLYTIRPK